ncbi:hypothetical protein ALI22I_03270 [Saccharothrix sp. ALI-22-I]|uniref:NADPH-dependent FMN reductase n=1 Tax=Saccharothrix sp. ALI-22-I TaxID=1933778 RepID=UPI00097C7AF4|nr:NAD(P)H-dependent oxidoreductase [Saccharothrix sp. ALI-22-I]ONI92545.1 hypothetical protein ALI22I_03270 [Saccharothrix sp. ALI-22-I]
MPASDDRLRVAIIVPSEGSAADRSAVEWLEGRARLRSDVEVDVITLTGEWLPVTQPADGGPTPYAVQDLAPWLADADAFVVVAEEASGMPASLRAAVSWHRDKWRAKPVAIVAIGARDCGGQVVDHLRETFVGLCATTIDGAIRWEGDAADRDQATDAMLDRLTWWARTLRDGRQAVGPGVPTAE